MSKKILHKVDEYYTDKIIEHGATSKGVDWNGRESHFLRFQQLSKVFNDKKNFSVLDYGCGFGSFIEFLNENSFENVKYIGYDISSEMLKQAQFNFSENTFLDNLETIDKVDFIIANGIFNVKLDTEIKDWENYIEDTLSVINNISKQGFSFNILTSYSDEEFKKDYLFYANPTYYFDYCKKNFSRNVALLHDYNLYEFTIIVKK